MLGDQEQVVAMLNAEREEHLERVRAIDKALGYLVGPDKKIPQREVDEVVERLLSRQHHDTT